MYEDVVPQLEGPAIECFGEHSLEKAFMLPCFYFLWQLDDYCLFDQLGVESSRTSRERLKYGASLVLQSTPCN